MSLSSGTVFDNVSVQDNSSMEVFDTTVTGTVVVHGTARLRMDISRITGNLEGYGSRTIEVNNSTVGGVVFAAVATKMTLGGGDFHAEKDVIATDNAFLTFSGGTIDGNLAGFGNSVTAMSGGHVAGYPIFQEHATFAYSGGTFGFAGNEPPEGSGAGGGAPLTLCADPEYVCPLPTNPTGFTILDSSQISFLGHDLESTLIDPNFEDMFSVFELTGRLADGTLINGGLVYVQNESGASLQLIEVPVPEPGSVTLLLCALTLGNAFRRYRC
jgi:hypothetical protein